MQITLATKFTIARIILIVPTVIIYILGMLLDNASCYLPMIITSAVLFSVLCATDFIDGHIARSTNTVSDLGKFLDPLADKVIIVVMLFLIVFFRDGLDHAFAYNGLIIAILSGIILSRELMISVFRSIAARKGCVLAADIFGKIKTVFLDVGVACLILAGTNIVLAWMGTVIFYIGAFFTIFSGFNYILKNKAVFSTSDSDARAEEASVSKAGESASAEKK